LTLLVALSRGRLAAPCKSLRITRHFNDNRMDNNEIAYHALQIASVVGEPYRKADGSAVLPDSLVREYYLAVISGA
jgi:hypothetical protein